MANNPVHKIEEFVHLSKADLHMHTLYSDGAPTVAELLDYIQNKTDINFIAITDHDTIEGALEAQTLMKKKEYRFGLVLGEEVSSQEGHILALFIQEKVPAGLTAHETIKNIHAQGGLAVAAHPFEQTRFNNSHMIMMDGVGAVTLINERKNFDGIEIVNATPTLNDENIRASALNKSMLSLSETGSSDAHIKEAVGRAYTLFEGRSISDLKKALQNQQTQAIQARWTIMALVKYLFFFIPRGLRIAINTIRHGRRPKRKDIF